MTILEIIRMADERRPNEFSDQLKMRWISELDGKIAANVFLMGIEEIRELEKNGSEGLNETPLVSYPHDDIYEAWLIAKIDEANGEYNRYQNSMQMYNALYNDYVLWFTSVYEPAQGCDGRPVPRSDVPQYYLTAYGIALKQGFVGTVDEWLESITAYGEAVKKGFKGTEEEWLDTLTAYGVAVKNGFQGTEEDWLISLSAYGVAVKNGFKGTEEDWLESIKGYRPKLSIGTVETLPYLSPATATITGPDDNPQLNLGIPRSTDDDLYKFIPEGSSANYYITSSGWKRIAVNIRANSGIVNLVASLNSAGYGRSVQNITFGYSMYVDHPSSKATEAAGGGARPGAHPYLYQLVNHSFCEDPSQVALSRVFRIDKVRVAYPLNYDDTTDADTNGRYSNPVNTYIDIHVVGNVDDTPSGIQLMTNIVGKSLNHNTEPIFRETDVEVSEDGYVLGLDGVKCQTYELRLMENTAFWIPDRSRMAELFADTFGNVTRAEIPANNGRLLQERYAVDKLEAQWGPANVDAMAYRVGYQDNLLPGNRKPTSSVGVTAKRIHSGIYNLRGTATANGIVKIYEYRAGDVPIVLEPGTYYVSGFQLRLVSELGTQEGLSDKAGYDSTRMVAQTLKVTLSKRMYVQRAALYWAKGCAFDGHLYYPQLTTDPDLIIGDLNVREADSVRTEYESYADQEKTFGRKAESYISWLERAKLSDCMYAPPPVVLELPEAVLAEKATIDFAESSMLISGEGSALVRNDHISLSAEAVKQACELRFWYRSAGSWFEASTCSVNGAVKQMLISKGKLAADLDAGEHRITNVADPVSDRDAAPAGYVLPRAGGQLEGAVTVKGLYLTPGVDLFDEVPAQIPQNKIVFVKVK